MAITDILQVKFLGQFTNEYEDSEILSEIDIVESNLYATYNLPKRSQFTIDDDYSKFYISPEKVYEIIRVQVAVDSDVDISGYIDVASAVDTWTFTSQTNYLTLASSFVTTYDAKTIRVQYIPSTYNTMASIITVLNLIDSVTIIDGEEQVPPLIGRLKGRLERLKKIIRPKIILKSSDFNSYSKYDYISYNQSNFR